MTTYTVGLDDTDGGHAAVRWVAAEPLTSGDVVKLVNVAELFGEPRAAAKQRIESVATDFRRDHPDVDVEIITTGGSVADRLLEHGNSGDILVVGCHRHRLITGVFDRWLPERIVSRSKVPVVVVPDDWTEGGDDIVVGVDAISPIRIIDFAASRARLRDQVVLLVNAWRIPTVATPFGAAYLPDDRPRYAEHSDRQLDRILTLAVTRFPTVWFQKRSLEGSAASALQRTARTASLVVIGREHRSALGGALLGSVGERLLRTMTRPIAVVPAEEAA
ncbi:universal stress protein [Curtobacterium sp. PhB115]|uniref:universal stress protein n=1 Tax=Curtobacterium sp. PhB115 TaxID=2485173 RepID=UPI00160D892D|nr:universal stress protein [Curtobacterium sp. PhB115]